MIKGLIANRNVLMEKYEKKKLEAEKATKLSDRYRERAQWITSLLIPIAKAIIEKEGFHDKFEILGPFGLTSSTSIWFWKTEEEYKYYRDDANRRAEDKLDSLISITFRPQSYYDDDNNYRTGLAVVNEGVDDGSCVKGSIGHMNGFHHPNISIDDWDLDKLVKFMYFRHEKKDS